jgi:hypothetical protein
LREVLKFYKELNSEIIELILLIYTALAGSNVGYEEMKSFPTQTLLKSLQQFFNENIDERSSSITSIVSKMI